MGRYYNKARGGRSLTLRDGTTAHFAAKRWTPVEKRLEGSAELLRAVRNGVLVYRPDPAPAPEPEPKPAPVSPDPEAVKEAAPEEPPALKPKPKPKAKAKAKVKSKPKSTTRKGKG